MTTTSIEALDNLPDSPSVEKSGFDFSAFGNLEVITRAQDNYTRMSVDFTELQRQRDFTELHGSKPRQKENSTNRKNLEELFRKEEEIRKLKKQVKSPESARRRGSEHEFRSPYSPPNFNSALPTSPYNGIPSWNYQNGDPTIYQNSQVNFPQSPNGFVSAEGTTRIRDSVSTHEYEKSVEKVNRLVKQIEQLRQENKVLRGKFNWWVLIAIWIWIISLLAMLALL